MQLIHNPPIGIWANILKRPYVDNSVVLCAVQNILSIVKEGGDAALKKLTLQFDGVVLDHLLVTEEEITAGVNDVPEDLKKAINVAKQNIETFHKCGLAKRQVVQTMEGIECWQKSSAIQKVGLYIPGGTAPLFSTVLMLGVPAQLAGCKEVVLCTPVNKEGKINAAILYTAQLCGIKKIYKVGGAQAIAAMAFGTDSIPQVYKIFGPGNQYVTAAKQLVQLSGVAIDMPAGPSEVCVLADESADARFIAADLLSQAEHGADSQVLLVSTSAAVVTQVMEELEKQLDLLPRKNLARKALDNSTAVVLDSMDNAIEMVNEYAAEHLIISCTDAVNIAEKITNAGSIFIGAYAPESVGDYASGTNHTLPTNAFARAYSGVNVDSFSKKMTFQKLSKEGLRNIGDTVICMAEAEGLQAHANAVKVRLESMGI